MGNLVEDTVSCLVINSCSCGHVGCEVVSRREHAGPWAQLRLRAHVLKVRTGFRTKLKIVYI